MANDYPYRLERETRSYGIEYSVYRTGEGRICTGDNHDEMRKLVDAANELERILAKEGR